LNLPRKAQGFINRVVLLDHRKVGPASRKTRSEKMEGKVKTYQTGVRADNDYADCPARAEFDIDRATAQTIIGLAALVRAQGLYKVEHFDYRVRWLKESASGSDNGEVSATDADTLRVSASEFWFGAYLKHASDGFVTERQSIADLARHFGITEAAPEATPEAAFVRQVAGLKCWNWCDDDGQLYDECPVPAEGEMDSHACLMGLVEQARKLQGAGTDPAAEARELRHAA